MIPVILGAVALGTAAVGALSGASGAANLREAKEIGQRAQERYEQALRQLNDQRELINQLAQRYGHLQQYVKLRTINGFVALIERINRRTADQEFLFLEAFDISLAQLETYQALALEALQFAKGNAAAVLMGAAASQSEMSLALSVNVTDVTNPSISRLNGASLGNATLAWLGGGLLALSDRGISSESLVLGEINLGSALEVGEFRLAGQGEKALIKAREYEAKVNRSIETLEAAKEYLQQVEQHIFELKRLVKNLNERVLRCLYELECELEFRNFDAVQDAAQFYKTARLVKALTEMIKTPILELQGQINFEMIRLQERYRTF